MKQIVLDYTPFLTRVALVDNGKLLAINGEDAKYRGIVGNIYKGKVVNVLNGMKAAFINIGLERNGFLYTGESLVDSNRLEEQMPKKKVKLSPGDVVMCQIVKEEFGNKGVRLTTDVSIPGNYLVMIPNSDFIGVSRKIEDPEKRAFLESMINDLRPQNTGFIIRSAADKATINDIKSEIEYLQSIWENIQKEYQLAKDSSLIYEDGSVFEKAIRDTLSIDIDSICVNDLSIAKSLEGKTGKIKVDYYDGERTIFSHFNLTEQINHICDRRVDLKSGGYLIIDKAEALTVIDVNTGKFVGDSSLEETVFKTNLEAADKIADVLLIRNLCGIIIIDFIDMVDEDHKLAVVEKLKDKLKNDPRKTTAISMTELGLVELTRKKTRRPIDDFMLQPCKNCGGSIVSDTHLLFLLRDELVDYIIKSRYTHTYVGVPDLIFDLVFESNIFKNHLQKDWIKKEIFFYKDSSLKRDEINISNKKPQQYENELKKLEVSCDIE